MKKDRKVSVGDLAPDFTLPDQTGAPVRLHDLVGRKNVVLYFYPKDETPGCTIEARAFRDSYEQFSAKDAQVVGYDLPFLLLSDRDGAVRRLYGVEKTLGLLPGRVTYVIDQTGVVRHVYSSQLRATRHPREALTVLSAMGGHGA